MRREGEFIFRGGRPIGRAIAPCHFEPLPSAAFEEREFLTELNWAWANYYDLAPPARAHLEELCPVECYSEFLDGWKLWACMRRREARERIVARCAVACWAAVARRCARAA